MDYSTSSKYKTTTSGTASSQDRITSCSVCIGESLGLFPYPKYTKEDPHICVNGMSQSFSWSEVFCGPDVDEKVLLSCPPRLWAFSLKFKTWRSVSYDSLRNIEPPDTSFEQDLFMKDSIKQPLGIIVSAYMKDTKDVKLVSSKGTVGRKGRGLNILLSGKTGTGKTLTAGKYVIANIVIINVSVLSFSNVQQNVSRRSSKFLYTQ